MGVKDSLGRVAEWFGFGVEDEDYYYEEEEERGRDPYANGSRETEQSHSVRRINRTERAAASGASMGNLFGGDAPSRGRYERPGAQGQRLRAVPDHQRQNPARVSVVEPSSFNDAQSLADRYKRDQPVILNLQSVDAELSRRMVDFCSGLTYAMDGNIQTVASRVFLLTPRNVEVSAEEKKRLAERAFFNQL